MLPIANYLRSIVHRGNAAVVSRAPPLRLRFTTTVATLIVAAGCVASEYQAIDATLNTDFQLRVGESASVSETMLKVGFIEVTSDSRCGKGEVCFWEGDGVVRIWLQKGGQEKIERELHTASNESRSTDYAGFRIRLVALNPARVSGVIIAPEEYIAITRVTGGES